MLDKQRIVSCAKSHNEVELYAFLVHEPCLADWVASRIKITAVRGQRHAIIRDVKTAVAAGDRDNFQPMSADDFGNINLPRPEI